MRTIWTLGSRESNKRYTFEESPIDKLYSPSEFGMEDWYGGNIGHVAELKDSHLFLILDRQYRVIDLALSPENIACANLRELRELAKKKNVKFATNTSKEEIIRLVKEAFE